MCSKFTGEHPYRSVISIQLHFIEITLRHGCSPVNLMHIFGTPFYKTPISAVSRAILKPVYRFGIPNSNPQTLKSVDLWCKLSSTFLVTKPRERCFELFRTENRQKCPGFCPWTPLGRAYNAAKLLEKSVPPKKLLDTALSMEGCF